MRRQPRTSASASSAAAAAGQQRCAMAVCAHWEARAPAQEGRGGMVGRLVGRLARLAGRGGLNARKRCQPDGGGARGLGSQRPAGGAGPHLEASRVALVAALWSLVLRAASEVARWRVRQSGRGVAAGRGCGGMAWNEWFEGAAAAFMGRQREIAQAGLRLSCGFSYLDGSRGRLCTRAAHNRASRRLTRALACCTGRRLRAAQLPPLCCCLGRRRPFGAAPLTRRPQHYTHAAGAIGRAAFSPPGLAS